MTQPRQCGSASRRYREIVNKLRIALVGAVGAALVATSSAAAFTPANAYYAKQWYLSRDNAFDAWDAPPPLDPVKVAIIDSGVDCSLPDLKDQIAKTKSFVGGNACDDHQGHGTIVAGEIAGPGHGRCRWYCLEVPVARGQGGCRRRDDPAQGRGGRHPLGRQPRGAGRQPQLRRRPGPGQSRSRLVLEDRGPGGGLRREEGSCGRCCGRERGRGVYDAVAVRER